MHDSKKVFLMILITAAVFGALGFYSAKIMENPGNQAGLAGANGAKPASKSGGSYQDGWEAAKKRLADSGFFPAMEEIRNVSGEVVAVDSGKISLKIYPVEPLADPALDNRQVAVDANTKIYMLEKKADDIYNKEMEDFNKKMQAMANQPADPNTPVEPILPPDFFNKKAVTLADIIPGRLINVSAESNIKEAREFTAAEITIQEQMIASEPAMPEAPVDGATAPIQTVEN